MDGMKEMKVEREIECCGLGRGGKEKKRKERK